MSSIYQGLAKLEQSGQPGVLCTIISTQGSTPRHEGSKMLVYADGETEGTIGGGEVEYLAVNAALEALKEGKPRIIQYAMIDPEKGDPGVCGGQMEIFVDPILPRRKLIVVGGGHVGKEVAFLGQWLGYFVVILDDRPGYGAPEAVPNGDEFHTGEIQDILNQVEYNSWTYVVLTTRNVEIDQEILPVLLNQNLPYVGVIGSKRRWRTTREKLIKKGIAADKIDQVFSPIGLDIHAETPKEIALSILAEVIMIQKGGNPASISRRINNTRSKTNEMTT